MILLLSMIILLSLLTLLFFYLFKGDIVQKSWKKGIKKAFDNNSEESRKKIILENDKKIIAFMINKHWYSIKNLKNIYLKNIESSAIDYIIENEEKELNIVHSVSFKKQQILDLSNKRLEKRKGYLNELKRDYLDPKTPFDHEITNYINILREKK